jgi:ornithine decarboxylase
MSTTTAPARRPVGGADAGAPAGAAPAAVASARPDGAPVAPGLPGALPLVAAALRAAAAEHGTPLLLLSPGIVRERYRALARALPRVALHYAVKSLPHPAVAATLADEDASFDLASSGEIALMRSVGVDGRRCLHTHPIKRPGDVADALAFGCRGFVFDNEAELSKLEPHRHEAELLLRVAFPNEMAQCDLSAKFGVDPDAAVALLKHAQARGHRVRGLSFHVGSQMPGPEPFVAAIRACRRIFDAARRGGVHGLDTLDIGGGFPVAYVSPVPAIADFCRPIRAALRLAFPTERVIAEPGRYISAPAMTLVTSVIGRAERAGVPWYYLDDGVYGSYSGLLFDHCEYAHIPLASLERPDLERRVSVLAGPTCDSVDVIDDAARMPELRTGDLLASPMMGAYTWASATDFNSLRRAKIVVRDGDPAPC